MTLNGTVSANGLICGSYSGGSAGGSVWLLCGTKLSGTGAVITANGGNTDKSGYHAAGGGYVSIWYGAMSDEVADWTVTANGGIRTGTTERTSQWGGNGKTYWRQWHKGLMLFAR